VQRDDRLAGAGAALDDGHAPVRRADDRVLLGLEGGDRRPHPARAACLEDLGERVVAQDVVGSCFGAVEEFVVDGAHRAAGQAQVAPAP